MPLSHLQPSCRTNEEVFFDHYPRLLVWAAQIAHNDRAVAEDLVHDLYLRVTRISRPIDQIEQVEHYLFKVLRNLHYAHLRQAGRDPISDLSIADYDSMEQGLAVADKRELLLVYDNLRQICRYACQRKSEVRSASVLILRFFHGYYPSELMTILQISRSAVDKLLHVARSEARLYIERPNSIRSIWPNTNSMASFAPKASGSQMLFFSELQETIFRATEGEHFDHAALEGRYAGEVEANGMATLELSHLVSCRSCLDMVNSLLQLPSLRDRSPEDGIDRDGPGNSGRASITPFNNKIAQKSSKKKLARRSRDLYEHRPVRLQIVVDGDVRSLQKVTAEVNELHLKLACKEQPLFIEVLSEQRFCLAFILVNDPDSPGELEQVESVSLSDDRTLTLTVSFSSETPIIHVLYCDPVMATIGVADINTNDVSRLDVIEAKSISIEESQPSVYRSDRQIQRWANGLSARLRECSRKLLIRNMNPFLASAILLTLGAVVCLWLWHKTTPPISAGRFLQRAEVADQIKVNPGESKVISQSIRIHAASQIIERVIHRDVSNQRKPKQQPLDQRVAALRTSLMEAGVKWDEPLSAASYEAWYRQSRVTRDSVRKTGETLLTLTTTIADANVTEESLTVRTEDFHPVARTISFRDESRVEIAELDYSIAPLSSTDQDWFEPVVKPAVSDSSLPTMHATVSLAHSLTELELDSAELTARTVLNQLHADTGEPINLVRSSTGIDVKGIVDTKARKRELLSHLWSIPNVHASILSAEEIGTRNLSGVETENEEPVKVYSVEAQISPLEEYLQEKNLPIEQLAPVSDNLLESSLRIIQAGTHFSEVQSRYKEANQLPTEVQTQMVDLSHNYAASITAGIYANKQILLSLGFVTRVSTPMAPEVNGPDSDVYELLRTYRQLCLEIIASNKSGQTRSAPVIAGEILEVGEQIRVYFANTSAASRKNNN